MRDAFFGGGGNLIGVEGKVVAVRGQRKSVGAEPQLRRKGSCGQVLWMRPGCGDAEAVDGVMRLGVVDGLVFVRGGVEDPVPAGGPDVVGNAVAAASELIRRVLRAIGFG